MRRRRVLLVTQALATLGVLTGCTSGPTVVSSQPVVSVRATPAASPSASPQAPLSSSPSPTSSAPTPVSIPSVSASGSKGCSNGHTNIPAGASTALIGDVDGDGKADTEFYSETPGPFTYGIRTAAGGIYTLHDDLAGPGIHSGWTAYVDAPINHLTVLDDGRTATLHAFVDCRFVTTYGTNGKPYTFGLNGFYTTGTGVACSHSNGGFLLQGVLAKRRSNGHYDILQTQIDVTADGRTASNGATITQATDLAAADPQVRAAMGSYCNNTPEVHTSGR